MRLMPSHISLARLEQEGGAPFQEIASPPRIEVPRAVTDIPQAMSRERHRLRPPFPFPVAGKGVCPLHADAKAEKVSRHDTLLYHLKMIMQYVGIDSRMVFPYC